MSVSPRALRVATFFSLLAALVLAPAARASGMRVERPVTDATPGATVSSPLPSQVFAPRSGASSVDPANPMREIAPGIYDGITPVQLPDGTWLVLLDERFLQFSVARRADGGGFAHACVSGFDGLARWRSTAPACVQAPARAGAPRPMLTTPAGTVATQWEER